MQIKIIENLSEFMAMESQWAETLKRYPQATIHVSVPWLRCWWETFGRGVQMCCLVADEGSELLGIAPLMIETRKIGAVRHSVLRLIGNDLSPRSHIVLINRKTEVLKAFLRKILSRSWLYFDVGQIPTGCDAERLLLSCVGDEFDSMQQRHIFSVAQITFKSSWKDYLASKSVNFRRSLRRSGLSNTNFECKDFPHDFDDLDRLMRDIRSVSEETWKHEQGTSLAADPLAWEFYKKLMAWSHVQGNLWVSLLYESSIPVAFIVIVRHDDVLYGLKTGYKRSNSDAAPGFYLMAHAVEMAFTQPAWTRMDLDSITTHGDWKHRWASDSTDVTSYYAFRRSLLSQILGQAYRIKKMVPQLPSNAKVLQKSVPPAS
jgi:CelD/BcsL family acetyltransferase involved in cellulose biosynthesis